MELQPRTSTEYIFMHIGAFIGSILTVGFISLVLFYLNKLIRRKEADILYVVLLAITITILLDLIEGYLSGIRCFRRFFAGMLIVFIWEKIRTKISVKEDN